MPVLQSLSRNVKTLEQPSSISRRISCSNHSKTILKRGIFGTYQHVSEQHLQRNLADLDSRYNKRVAMGRNPFGQGPIERQLTKGKGAVHSPKVPRSKRRMQKKKGSDLTREEQFKRFQEDAKEHEIEKQLPKIEKAFDGRPGCKKVSKK
jgi:hypothetical protein